MPALRSSKISLGTGRKEQFFFHTPSLTSLSSCLSLGNATYGSRAAHAPQVAGPWPVVLCRCCHLNQIEAMTAKGCGFGFFIK